MKTVVFLCGLIGSGKTTYAKTHYKNFTDLDHMPPFSRKLDQINWTRRLLAINSEVCHITCYPTLEELRALRPFEQKFIWINTSFEQAQKNIVMRNRPRDMADLARVFKANAEYQRRFQMHRSAFAIVNNYGRGEI